MDDLDVAATIDRIVDELRAKARSLTRRGAVVGVSGGVDSAVGAALAVRAFPVDRVRLLHLPDQDTAPDSTTLAAHLATSLGCELRTHDITAALRGLDVYHELAARVATVLDRSEPDIAGWKLVRTEPVASLPVRWKVAATLADGSSVTSATLRPNDLAYIVARQNQKQQMRASVLYQAADEEHLLVVGTANRVEIRTGFFVRHGDGAGDHFPLRRLFKGEVRRVATALGIDPAIAARTAMTDTFSDTQTQREFYFGVDEVPFDHILDGFERGRPEAEVAVDAGVSVDLVAGVYADLTRRQPFLRYLLSYALTEDLCSSAAWLDELDLHVGPPDAVMGTRSLDPARWICVDDDWLAQRDESRALLRERRSDVVAGAATDAARALAARIDGWLAAHHPDLVDDGHVGERDPMAAAALRVAEDLCLLLPGPAGWELAAASVCFPSYWVLATKIGRPLADVHGRVPGYPGALAARVDSFLGRLRAGQGVWRRNWSFHDDPALYLPAHAEHAVPTPVPDGRWLRSEYQTLLRLETSEAVVFTIRTQQIPLARLAERPDRCAAFAQVLRGWSPAQWAYKGAAVDDALLTWLDEHAA